MCSAEVIYWLTYSIYHVDYFCVANFFSSKLSERTASAESRKLVGLLMPLRNDPGKLLELLEKQNLATIGEVGAKLLDNAAHAHENDVSHRPG